MNAVDLDLIAEAIAHTEDPDDLDALMVPLREYLETDWRAWLRHLFPVFLTAGFAPHHEEFWEWLWSIRLGEPAVAGVGIWPRGGAKSTSVELGLAALAARDRRRYVLYVCGKEAKAIDHVGNVAAMLESARVADLYPQIGERLLGKFGNAKGWRANRRRTVSGFTLDAVGLDSITRGAKLDEERPDLIVFDDIDVETDTPLTTQKKIEQITRAFLPALAQGGIVLAVQNVVITNGFFARLAGVAEQPAEFLQDRVLFGGGVIPAAHGLELGKDEDGKSFVISGQPTWEGQSLQVIEAQVREWGPTAFRVEAQHQVELRTGGMFRAWDWMGDDGQGGSRWVDGPMEGLGIARVRAWDTAGTEFTGDNDPDWTAGALIAYDPDQKRYRIEHVERFRHASGTRNNLMRLRAEADANLYGLNGVTQLVEQRPGDLGRDEADHYVRTVFEGLVARKVPPTGTKVERAEGLAAAMENGLVTIVTDDTWTRTFLAECEGFPLGDHDDQVDAASHALNYLRKRGGESGGISADAGAAAGRIRR